MCEDERQRVLVFRTNVNEVDVQPINLGHEIRQGVQSRLDLAPVVLGRPIAREFLHRRELGALRLIGDRLPVRPAGRAYASAQFGQFGVREIHAKWTNGVVRRRGDLGRSHGSLLLSMSV